MSANGERGGAADIDAALLDQRAARLYHRYCRAVDGGDLDELAAMVVPDVLLTRLDGTKQGVGHFLDLYRDFNATKQGDSYHEVFTVLAAARPDGSIGTRAYFRATFVEPAQTRVVLGKYEDLHVERNGEYLIARKVIRVEHGLTLPAAG